MSEHDRARPDTLPEPVRTLPIDTAAALVGVHAKTIRRWIARGHLEAVAGPRGRLVNLADVERLAAERLTSPDVSEPARAFPGTAPDPGPDRPELVRALEVIERQQRDLVELSGRVGWLMSELEQARATIRQLQAPTSPVGETPPASMSYGSAEVENGPRIDVHAAGSVPNGAERPLERENSRVASETPNHTAHPVIAAQQAPGWAFWKRGSAQPV